jgi:hypothetical protein
MMPLPYNYQLQAQNPMQSMNEAMRMYSSMQGMQQQKQESLQTQEINRQNIQQNAIKLQAQRALQQEQQVEATQQATFQSEAAKFSELPPEEQTQSERARLLRMLPGGMKKQIETAYEALPKEQAEQMRQQSGEIYSLLSNPKTEKLGLERMESLASIYETDKDPANDAKAQSLRAMVKAGPGAALLQIGVGLGATEIGRGMVDAVDKTNRSTEKSAQSKEDILAKKTDTAIKKIELELAQSGEAGELDTEKKFIFEEKLRKEFGARTKLYKELTPVYNNIKSSAESKNGPGDIALITSFMKMLDPGSVVRETEFATARNTTGLYDRLKNQISNLNDGTLISLKSNQREQYVALAKKYLQAAQNQARKEKASVGIVSKNYGLNDDNIFGVFGQKEPNLDDTPEPPTGGVDQPPENRNIQVSW